MKLKQEPLFGDQYERAARQLPAVAEQSDIRYYATTAKNVLNGPEVTGMGFWSINPYVGCALGCAYCYARYAHRYVAERVASNEAADETLSADLKAMAPWLAFERRIFVKRNAPELIARTLRYGSDRHLKLINGETIVIGTATDPYQPAERRFRLTRGILEALANHPGLSVVIITKSPLVTRDIDVMLRLMRHSKVQIHLSLITLDRDLARRIEPRSPTPDARVRALRRLREAGIDAGINCMPVLPGITDNPNDLEALVKCVAEAGATYVGACTLRLQSTARARYLPFIDQEFPHLSERYRRTYASSPAVGRKYSEGLHRFFRKLCARHGVRDWSYDPETAYNGTETGADVVRAVQLELPI